MIISHVKKFAYFRTPKTGSTTQEFMLRISGAFNDESDVLTNTPVGQLGHQNLPNYRNEDGKLNNPWLEYNAHITPQVALEQGLMTMDQFREYDCYAFMREPRKRHLSGIVHALGRHVAPEDVHRVLNTTLAEMDGHPNQKRLLGLLTIPQSEYFYVNGELLIQPLKFSDFQNELRKIIKRVDGIDFPVIPRMNARSAWRDNFTEEQFWTPEYIERFEYSYREDIRLFEAIDNWPPEPDPNWKPTPFAEVFTRAHLRERNAALRAAKPVPKERTAA